MVNTPNYYSSRLKKDELTIFLFHGVIIEHKHLVQNYTRKHIDQFHFRNVLKKLKEKGHAISMSEAFYHFINKKPFPAFSYVITFDDGFENNFSVAAPILTEMSIPAIFYIATNFIDTNGMGWTDKMEFCIDKISSGKLYFEWDKDYDYSFQNNKDKIRILKRFREVIKNDSSINTYNFISSLFNQCNIKEIESAHDSLHMKMNWNQVVELDSSNLFEVAGHSHLHEVLSFMGYSDMVNDINISLKLLKEKASIKSNNYCYPEGLEHCFNLSVINVLKSNGIICCPSAIDGTNPLDSDLFSLKRIFVV